MQAYLSQRLPCGRRDGVGDDDDDEAENLHGRQLKYKLILHATCISRTKSIAWLYNYLSKTIYRQKLTVPTHAGRRWVAYCAFLYGSLLLLYAVVSITKHARMRVYHAIR